MDLHPDHTVHTAQILGTVHASQLIEEYTNKYLNSVEQEYNDKVVLDGLWKHTSRVREQQEKLQDKG